MARQLFSKAALHKEVAQIKRYQQFLPSLDLKRQRLIAERYKCSASIVNIERLIEQNRSIIAESLPMFSNHNIDLNDLVTVSKVDIGNENNAGVNLPVVKKIIIDIKPYSIYAKPHWVDQAVIELKAMLELRVQLLVEQHKLEILGAAVKKVTQRLNFFEKILIPRAQQKVKKISIFLSDAERASIVRSKITKQKRLKQDKACP